MAENSYTDQTLSTIHRVSKRRRQHKASIKLDWASQKDDRSSQTSSRHLLQ